ncbi:MAG: XRE family transcriptional regulator [Saprospiraceae bacterium]|uniref:XRE family transcriptional regulator n=1 Tax=Candidatus Opimibacter skivensis TaxID=2982028 RepID=A0A9D7SZ77_9BACT|nr:XRE family transcriptional regulator [Candidatus Opimibacter skivensis]
MLAEFPKDRQEKIKAKANEYIREYKKLADLRKELGITQEMIARHQGIKQVNISNLEKRHDMLLSTLHKYVNSLGGKLDIRIQFPNAESINVKSLNVKSGKVKPIAARTRIASKKI